MGIMKETDKDVISMLEFCDEYYAAWRFQQLKNENAVLKGQITKLKKKLK